MRIIDPSFRIEMDFDDDELVDALEAAARTCYKSEDKASPENRGKLLRKIMLSGHLSVLEHRSISVRIICDRGITHELVRHRLCSFSQESTRYCNYASGRFGNEIEVVRPFFWAKDYALRYMMWAMAMEATEHAYLKLIDAGATAQEARSVLPNSLKTEIVVTANIREWQHIFRLRCDKTAHPQMRQIMEPLLLAFTDKHPLLFYPLVVDLKESHQGKWPTIPEEFHARRELIIYDQQTPAHDATEESHATE